MFFNLSFADELSEFPWCPQLGSKHQRGVKAFTRDFPSRFVIFVVTSRHVTLSIASDPFQL